MKSAMIASDSLSTGTKPREGSDSTLLVLAAAASEQCTSDSTLAQCNPGVERKMVINELLFFLNNVYDCHPRSIIHMHSTIADFYRENEILSAKSSHADMLEVSTIQAYVRKCIGENKVERSVDDILNIFASLDEADAPDQLPVFCAASLSRIPVDT